MAKLLEASSFLVLEINSIITLQYPKSTNEAFVMPQDIPVHYHV